MNQELPDVQAGFRKGRRTRDQIANIHWIIEKAREFQKNICFVDHTKAFDCVDHNKLWKIIQEMGILRESIPRQVDKSGVPEEKRRVWDSQGGDGGLELSLRIFQFVVIHTVKGFGIVNKAVDVFLELSCFFDDPMDVDNLISGSSAFSKSSLNIWKFTVHLLFKPGLGNFEHYFNRV